MSILVSTGLVEPVVRYCCLCTVVFSNLVTFAMQEKIEQRYAFKFWERIRKRVQLVRRDIADDWVLQNDNAPAHTALSIREFMVKKNIPVLPHPLYSPDLAPCDFYRSHKLKSKLKGHHFGATENIQKKL